MAGQRRGSLDMVATCANRNSQECGTEHTRFLFIDSNLLCVLGHLSTHHAGVGRRVMDAALIGQAWARDGTLVRFKGWDRCDPTEAVWRLEMDFLREVRVTFSHSALVLVLSADYIWDL